MAVMFVLVSGLGLGLVPVLVLAFRDKGVKLILKDSVRLGFKTELFKRGSCQLG